MKRLPSCAPDFNTFRLGLGRLTINERLSGAGHPSKREACARIMGNGFLHPTSSIQLHSVLLDVISEIEKSFSDGPELS